MQTKDHVQLAEENRRATAAIAWAISNDSRLSDISDPAATFAAHGYKAYVPMTKTAIAPIASDNTAVSLLPLNAAFLGVVGRQSIIGQIDGAVRIDIAAAARMQVLNITASSVVEGAAKPTSRTTFALAGAPTKVSAQITVTDEALTFLGSTGDGLMRVLASACAAASDAALVTALTGGSPASAAPADVLLAAISNGAPVRPVIIGGFDGLLGWPAGTLRDLKDLGVQVLVSPAAAGKVIALDAAALLVSDEGIEIQTAKHATTVLDDGGGSPSTTLVSLWQKISSRSERNNGRDSLFAAARSPMGRCKAMTGQYSAAHLAAFGAYRLRGFRLDGLTEPQLAALAEDPGFSCELAAHRRKLADEAARKATPATPAPKAAPPKPWIKDLGTNEEQLFAEVDEAIRAAGEEGDPTKGAALFEKYENCRDWPAVERVLFRLWHLTAFVAAGRRKRLLAAIEQRLAELEARDVERQKEVSDLQARPLGVRYEGVHVPGKAYTADVGVTKDGSMFVSRVATCQTPGTGSDWTLAIKRGKDAR